LLQLVNLLPLLPYHPERYPEHMQVRRVSRDAIDWNSVPVPASFLQHPFWAEFKNRYGWVPFFFIVDENFISVLVRKIPHLGSIAYIPMGPESTTQLESSRQDLLLTLVKEIKPLLPSDTFLLRFDPPWEKDDQKLSIKKAGMDIQPPDTVILDLLPSEENILAQMKPKWRYNIRLTAKKGVRVCSYFGKETITKGLPVFWELYKETAKRDGIAIHSQKYYQDLLETVLDYPKTAKIIIYTADHEGDSLAAIVVLFYGNQATYLYGASSNIKRNLMPAYALQWQAITEAKAAGCLTYDFYGIPPSDDPTHPMYGLYRFKTGFGGTLVHRIGSLDIPVRTFRYHVYSILETLRTLWFKKIKKIFNKR